MSDRATLERLFMQQGRVFRSPPNTQKSLDDAKKSPTFVDLTGRRINKLTVIGLRKEGVRAWDNARGRSWVCRCDCGLYTALRSAKLKKGTPYACDVCQQEKYWSSLSGAPDAPP